VTVSAPSACDSFGQAVLHREVEAVTSAAIAVWRSPYLEVGGFDETNVPVAFNDVDLWLRLRERGLRNIHVPSADVTHPGNRSRGTDSDPEASERLRREPASMRSRWGRDGRDLLDRIKNPCFVSARGDALLPRVSP